MSDPDDRVTNYNSCISSSRSNDIWWAQKIIFSTKLWGSIYANGNGFFTFPRKYGNKYGEK